MIISVETPYFDILNISFVDMDQKRSLTASFTRDQIIEKNKYLDRSEFVDFPAEFIDDTLNIDLDVEKE